MKTNLSDEPALSNHVPRCPARSRAGVTYSAAIILALSVSNAGALPPNDDFGAASVVAGASGFALGRNEGATVESGEPDRGEEFGGASVWWQWTATEDAVVTYHTFGSEFDTMLSVYTGDQVESLTLVAENDDAGTLVQSMVSFEALAGTAYHISVDRCETGSGLVALHWGELLANDDFGAATVISGTSGITAGLNDEAGREAGEPDHAANHGGASLWWQWTAPENRDVAFDTFGSDFDTLLAVYTDGSAGSLTLVAGNDNAGPDGQSLVSFAAVAGTTYHIAVDGFAPDAGIEAETGTVVLNWGQPLTNDDFASATAITGASGMATGRNEGATMEAGEPDHPEGTGGASVWWQWTAPDNGVVGVDTFGSDFDTLLAVYTGDSVGGLELVAASDDFEDSIFSLASFNAVAGTIYRIAVDGYDGEMGKLVLNWGPLAGNDDFSHATVIAGMSGAASGRNTGATMEAGEPDHADESGGASIWWRWTAPASGVVTFDTFGSDFDTLLAIYTGNSAGNLTAVAGNDDFGDDLQSLVSFVAVEGTTYRIAVDGYDGDIGKVILNWGPPPASFASWSAGVGLSGLGAAADADPDADGLPNAAEYVLGGNPVEPATAARPAATVSDGSMIFSFTRNDASETSDVTVTVESGTDFQSWPEVCLIGPHTAASGPGVSISENGSAPDTITVTIPIGPDKTKFARLKVTVTP